MKISNFVLKHAVMKLPIGYESLMVMNLLCPVSSHLHHSQTQSGIMTVATGNRNPFSYALILLIFTLQRPNQASRLLQLAIENSFSYALFLLLSTLNRPNHPITSPPLHSTFLIHQSTRLLVRKYI